MAVNMRDSDPKDLDPKHVKSLRQWRLGESSVAVVLALLTAGSSALYTKFQTDQNTKDLVTMQRVQAELWAKREADKDMIDTRLQHIEAQLNELIGRSERNR